MSLNAQASALLAFLILYTIPFLILLNEYVSHLLQLHSQYTIIFFHVTIRVALQATGLASGIAGLSNLYLLVAYYILGAEGYITLVWCSYRFLINWQYQNTPSHDSWLEPRQITHRKWYIRLRDSFALPGSGRQRHPMGVMHLLLLGANGVKFAGAYGEDPNLLDVKATLNKAKILRVVGQSIFVAVNMFFLYRIYSAMKENKREREREGMAMKMGHREVQTQAAATVRNYTSWGTRPKQWAGVHPTLWLLLATWPLLIIRGVYGVVASVLSAFSFFNPENYGADGLSPSFVTNEYILSVLMECASCVLLMLIFWSSHHDPLLEPIPEERDSNLEGDGDVQRMREFV